MGLIYLDICNHVAKSCYLCEILMATLERMLELNYYKELANHYKL